MKNNLHSRLREMILSKDLDYDLLREILDNIKEENVEKVNHPKHYNSHPSGIECINLVESFSFNFGNAIKYIWRAGLKKTSESEDLKKARFYLEREIDNRLGPWTDNGIFDKEIYSVSFDTIFVKDIIVIVDKIIESDNSSLLSCVLKAYLNNKNPLKAFDRYIENLFIE